MGELNLKEAVTKGKSVKTCICFSIQKSGFCPTETFTYVHY